MTREHSRWVVPLAILAVFIVARKAHGQNAATAVSHLYQLGNQSTFQRGCFAPCMCPLMESVPLRGSFVLTPGVSDPLYQNYLVTNVKFEAVTGASSLHITGSGTYRVGGEVVLTQQLQLDLQINAEPIQHFDSGLVSGGSGFPHIDIVVSIHGQYCNDTVLHLDASPVMIEPMPRHAVFVVDSSMSDVDFSLFVGGTHSAVAGVIQLFIGDPRVPVIAQAGVVGVSVDRAELIALDFEPDLTLPEPLHMINDPAHCSTGAWYSTSDTGVLHLDLYLKGVEAGLPVPQPLHLSGHLAFGQLLLSGDNGNVADGLMELFLQAREVNLPPPPLDIWFSTKSGFTSGRLQSLASNTAHISPGDLLSRRGFVVRKNRQLTARLGIMPIVPDLGLDAVTVGSAGRVWFSFEPQNAQIWSETLGRWLKHGDLLSEDGHFVASNEDLLARFVRMPPVIDAGLDAVSVASNREILFSTNAGFYSQALGHKVSHGDVLSNRGRVVMTNAQLLRNFHISNVGIPQPGDFGLDALIVRPAREFWFSTKVGFTDKLLGPISDGDLLSTNGYVIARNRDLVSAFAPVEDLSNFGLDAACLPVVSAAGDFDLDGSVGLGDLAIFGNARSRPAVPAEQPELGDLDGDGDIDLDDFGILQRSLGAPGNLP